MERTQRGPALRTRRIAILAYDGAQSLDIIGPFEVFAMASQYLARKVTSAAPAYAVELVSAHGGPVVTSSGMTMIAHRATGSINGGVDTLLVAGGDVRRTLEDRPTLRWLLRMAGRVRRLGSVCSGAFILAEVGLLDGRRATTHWAGAAALAQRYPRITVEPDAIFIREGNLYTSAGITAGMDLALALVEEDHGHRVALAVARYLVMFLKRPGGQSQFSTQLALQATPRRTLTDVPEWILEHLDSDLSVEALAARAAMSPRHFARVFHRELGVTPAKFVERARVEQARRLLEETSWSLEELAGACGFGTAERMRRTFQRHLRVVPHDYRRRFEHAASGQQGVREGRRSVHTITHRTARARLAAKGRHA